MKQLLQGGGGASHCSLSRQSRVEFSGSRPLLSVEAGSKGGAGKGRLVGAESVSLYSWTQSTFFPFYLCTWEAASRCHSPDTCSVRRPPWRSRQNTSTRPRPRTGRLPPGPPHWPRGGAVRKRLLIEGGSGYFLLLDPRLRSRQIYINRLPDRRITLSFLVFDINWVLRFAKRFALLYWVILSLVQISLNLCETGATVNRHTLHWRNMCGIKFCLFVWCVCVVWHL